VLDRWLPFLIYASFAFAIPATMVLMSFLFATRPSRRTRVRELPFESGVSTGPPRQQRFTISFYLTAMLFIVFDIEIVFFYPLGVILDRLGWFGFVEFRSSPRQADLLIVSGRVAHKMAAPLRQIYDQMLEPKWVIAMGACASSGGMFNNYSVLQGVDKIVAVDVHVPGCPPRPEALVEGIVRLQEKIKAGVPPAYDIRGVAS
jgi:NADH-quinone oxidoreductase B subunit